MSEIEEDPLINASLIDVKKILKEKKADEITNIACNMLPMWKDIMGKMKDLELRIKKLESKS